ncbi:type II secretion system F family protein [Arthrobacter sp. NPDC097144]|uniref:type II secretion system F family protein n=1 Tax=Arthrobacter sp. NPDC097144 TaxID=3363946 RepID=UPI00380799BA
MTGFWVAILLGAGAALLLPDSRVPVQLSMRPFPRWPVDAVPGRSLQRRFRRRRSDPALQDLPLLIHQLTGLLAAGRAPHVLWADAAALQTISGPQPDGSLAQRLLPVLDAAAQAASLGLSPAPVFQAAARDGQRSRLDPARRTGRKGSGRTDPLAALWVELAACVAVSERSGAALAGVLGRYAAQLESGLDSEAARETAMAGPQATVRLLTWLPAGGLGLGYVLGGDPLGVLLGSPWGWVAGAAGVALSLIGRFWSRTLVRQAAGS